MSKVCLLRPLGWGYPWDVQGHRQHKCHTHTHAHTNTHARIASIRSLRVTADGEDEDPADSGFRPHAFARMRCEFVRAFKAQVKDRFTGTAKELNLQAQTMWMQSAVRAKALSSLSEKELKRRRFL